MVGRAELERVIASSHPTVRELVDVAEDIVEHYRSIADESGARYHDLASRFPNGYAIVGYLADAGIFERVDHTGEQGIELCYKLTENPESLLRS